MLELHNYSNRSSKHIVLLVSGFLSQNYSGIELWKNIKDEWQLQRYLSCVIKSMPKRAESLLSLMRKENERFKEINAHYRTGLVKSLFDLDSLAISGQVIKM